MGLVAAKCTQCGANIKVDANKESGVCSHCGTEFITEKAINNYTIHNHNTVNNNIAHATVNVKNGDGIDDYLRRYLANAEEKKYNAAADVVRKMDEKFPDSGITRYCQADMHLNVKGYYGWLNYLELGCDEYWYPEIYATGVTSTTGKDGKCRVFEESSYFPDYEELGKAYDEFEKLSDGELLERAKNDRMVLPDGDRGRIDLTYISPVDAMDVGFDLPNDEEIFDEKEFDTEEDHYYSSGLSHNFYLRAEYCARKCIGSAKRRSTDEEREKYADFINSVIKKYETFKALAERRERAKKRLNDLNVEAEKLRKKEANSACGGGKAKKFLKGLVVFAVFAVIVAVAVIVVKKVL